jgi:predicted glycoside hydrolase/deacetylase ChbG (UPF0249 family)
MKGSRRLLINADDFGLHASINEAVAEACQNGILRSASLCVNGDAFEEAAAIARENRQLGVGIHLTLNGEKPVASREAIPSLLDENGYLMESHGTLFRKILTGGVRLEQIALECRAQIEKFLDRGLVPTHLDGHRHVHLFPPIFRLLKTILAEHHIRKIRWLRVPMHDFWMGPSLPHIAFLILLLETNRLLKGAGLRHPDWFLGYFNSDSLNVRYFARILERIPPGTTEIALHPGRDNRRLTKHYRSWSEKHDWHGNWEEQYRLLLDKDIANRITAGGISLIHYGQV